LPGARESFNAGIEFAQGLRLKPAPFVKMHGVSIHMCRLDLQPVSSRLNESSAQTTALALRPNGDVRYRSATRTLE
jgi:hypothetical protein